MPKKRLSSGFNTGSVEYDDLTPSQRTYMELRCAGKSAYDAAIGAGYAESFARKAPAALERHPVIRTAIRASTQKAMKELALSRQDVLQGLLDAVDLAATSTELTAAWREIGKVIGAYEPQKVQIDVHHVTSEQLRDMTTQELAVLANMQGVIDGEYTVDDEEAA